MKLTRYLSSPTLLLLVVIWLIIIGLAVNLTSCQKKTERIEPVANADTLAPKITNMAIPGIPAENIRIDQVNRQLIVTLPKSFSATYTNSTWIQMTPGAKLARLTRVGIDFCFNRFYDAGFSAVTAEDMLYDSRELIITDGAKSKKYRIQFKQEGDLRFVAPNKVYQLKSDGMGETFANVVIENYRDTSASSKLVYTNLITNEEFTFDADRCQLTGKMFPYSSFRVMPLGNYSVTIRKSNGRQSANNLWMKLSAGKATVYEFHHALNWGYLMKINGNSLYEGNFKALEVSSNRTGATYLLPILKYNQSGAEIEVKLPESIPTGKYQAKIIYNDGSRSEKQRGAILKTAIQPQFDLSILGAIFRRETNDLLLKRGGEYYIWPSPKDEIVRGTGLYIFFQSINTPTVNYTLPVTIPSGFRYAISPETLDPYPRFTIPSTINPDNYLMRLQYRDVSGIDQIGDWYDYDVEIQ